MDSLQPGPKGPPPTHEQFLAKPVIGPVPRRGVSKSFSQIDRRSKSQTPGVTCRKSEDAARKFLSDAS